MGSTFCVTACQRQLQEGACYLSDPVCHGPCSDSGEPPWTCQGSQKPSGAQAHPESALSQPRVGRRAKGLGLSGQCPLSSPPGPCRHTPGWPMRRLQPPPQGFRPVAASASSPRSRACHGDSTAPSVSQVTPGRGMSQETKGSLRGLRGLS